MGDSQGGELKSAPGKLDTNGQAVQEHAVYRARVQGKTGSLLVQAVSGFDGELGFWDEGVHYLVNPDAVEIISERVLPPWPRSTTALKTGGELKITANTIWRFANGRNPGQPSPDPEPGEACGNRCLTIPDAVYPILCNLRAGHEGEHAKVYDRRGWRNWPVNQTEALPLQ